MQLTRKISLFLVDNKVINSKDREIYEYGFEIFFSTAINFFALMVIAIMLDKLPETLLFVVGFVPLRSMAGGYHAKTHWGCFITLIATFSIFLLIVSFLQHSLIAFVNSISILLFILPVFILAPVDVENRRLSDDEKIKFRKSSRITVCVLAAFVLVGTIVFNISYFSLCVTLGALMAAGSLVFEKIRSISRVNPGWDTFLEKGE